MSHSNPLTVAVVGATGVVGRTMVQVLARAGLPDRRAAAARVGPIGGPDRVGGRTIARSRSRRPRRDAFEGVDIALFSAGARHLAGARARRPAARGATVIDNSIAWRMDPGVPLVVSQVNPDDLAAHEGIIANPNCSTMQLVPVLMALRDSVGIERVVVDTYQSVSGTGAERDRRARGPDPRPRRRRAQDGHRVPPPDRVQRRCPRSTSSSTTATRRRSGRSSPRAARSSTCPICGSRARPSGSRCS